MLKQKKKEESKLAIGMLGFFAYILIILGAIAAVIFIPAYTGSYVSGGGYEGGAWFLAWVLGLIFWIMIIAIFFGLLLNFESISRSSINLGNKILRR
jgi:hypothetical protein